MSDTIMPTYTGNLLRVNLSTGQITTENIDKSIFEDFIGGRGLGISYLHRELEPNTDPLGEDNKLLLLNGPLAGTNAQAVSRWIACTKSPLTGAVARSVAGADFGAWLKFAGYDLIIIEGKANQPVYIHLTNESCQIRDARDIWGKNTLETQELLNQRHGETTRSACIGPAGENLVNYAAIVSARRTAGRCGTGTVMGSKKLKAIAINAQRRVHQHDPDMFKQLVKEQISLIKANKVYHKHAEWGTTDTHDTTNLLGIYPVRNFRFGQQNGHEKLSAEEYRRLRTGEFGCYSCMAQCGKEHTVSSGPYAGALSEGPEYESIWAFSGPIDSDNIEATIAADQMCDDLGIDTISTGNIIGFAYELYEKGILTKKDSDGLNLTYGNHQSMIALIKKIAYREGIGNILAEGSRKAAAIIGKGAEAYAIHVKGLELPAYEPRGSKCQGFNYATSNIGGSHAYGYAGQEVLGWPFPRIVDPFAEEENADVVVFNQNRNAMGEVGVVCSFSMGWGWFPALFSKMLVATTGIDQFADIDYLWKVGERIVNLERCFNSNQGFSREHDTLPPRILREPLLAEETPSNGQMVKNQDKFLDRYYQIRGWTKEGIPTPQKLKELNIDYALKDVK
jgi:aldehyde:ferredoxin oxidoreductase